MEKYEDGYLTINSGRIIGIASLWESAKRMERDQDGKSAVDAAYWQGAVMAYIDALDVLGFSAVGEGSVAGHGLRIRSGKPAEEIQKPETLWDALKYLEDKGITEFDLYHKDIDDVFPTVCGLTQASFTEYGKRVFERVLAAEVVDIFADGMACITVTGCKYREIESLATHRAGDCPSSLWRMLFTDSE